MAEKIANGTVRTINGKDSIYFDGYWIRHNKVIENTLANKKQLIDQLTKRVFHHVEAGVNTPGKRTEDIRAIYEKETNPAKKRVKGAMLAGALLNRGADILTAIVALEEAGVKIEPGNQLLKQCGKYFMEALELGKNIKLASGGEGLDELWGEPFKVLHMTMEEFYQSRYIKVGMTMKQIDRITGFLIELSSHYKELHGAVELITELSESAKLSCETLRSDPASFEIWPRFVAAKEHFEDHVTALIDNYSGEGGDSRKGIKAIILFRDGGQIIVNLSIVRVPMPESVNKYIERCNTFMENQDQIQTK